MCVYLAWYLLTYGGPICDLTIGTLHDIASFPAFIVEAGKPKTLEVMSEGHFLRSCNS